MKALLALLSFLASEVMAQGPSLSYLADPGTELSFAESHVYVEGGSRHKIPFLPIVNAKGAPCGTERYTKDVRLKAPLAFVGNGAGADAYAGLDVTGKVVLLGYDFPDGNEVSLEDRIREAAGRKAAGVVLFSVREDHPFPLFHEQALDRIPEIPVIAIGKRDAAVILASAGRDAEQLFRAWERDRKARPEILTANLDLRIDGRFQMIETGNFTFAFQPRGITRDAAAALAETSERAMQFDLDLFREMEPRWKKTFAVYFAGFDSKVFFLHHWGVGRGDDAGIFMVYNGRDPDFGLVSHENAHVLMGQNWGESSSFLSEGIGKYAEAMATDKMKNHRETTANRRAGKLFSLEEMSRIEIGTDPRTEVAYPAAGSFVHFLVEKYSLRKLKVAYQGAGVPAIWTAAYGKTLTELEREWLEHLRFVTQ